MNAAPPPGTVSVKASWRTLSLVASALVFFTVGSAALVFWIVWPSGKAVGETPCYPPGRPIDVELAAGDRLVFRIDVSVEMAGSNDSDEDRAHERLRDSKLTVTAARAGAAPLTASCGSYANRAMMTSIGNRTLSLRGVLVDCEIPIAAAGTYAVSGAIAPTSGLSMNKATLEVRRARGK